MASSTPTTPNKGKAVLLKVIGDPLPGFSGGEFPTLRDVAAFWMWLDEHRIGYRKGAKNSDDNSKIVHTIVDALMVYWREIDSTIVLDKKKNVKDRVRELIKKLKSLKRHTYDLENDQWIAKQKVVLSFVMDIAVKTNNTPMEVWTMELLISIVSVTSKLSNQVLGGDAHKSLIK